MYVPKRAQYLLTMVLIKECASNDIGIPKRIEGVFLNEEVLGSVGRGLNDSQYHFEVYSIEVSDALALLGIWDQSGDY